MQRTLETLVGELGATGDVTAVSAVLRVGGRDAHAAWGAESDHWFDYASLTKPFVATLALVLAEDGSLELGQAVGEVLAEARGPVQNATLGDLLRHRSGLRPWRPLFAELPERSGLVGKVGGEEGWLGPGERYSDLGYLLAASMIERRTGQTLTGLVRERVLAPLGLESEVGLAPGPRANVVVSELSNAREVELAAELGIDVQVEPGPWHGVPQDGNARFLGGLPGHAGLFGTAEAVARLGAAWLTDGALLPDDVCRAALTGGDRYALGWWHAGPCEAAGDALGRDSFGMVGFSGGSIWVDPARGAAAVLLTHRRSVAVSLDPWRHRLHALAASVA